MAWEYTSFDVQLCDEAVLELKTGVPGSDGKNRTGRIQFQFPPKITTDSRKSTWSDTDQRGSEPRFEYMTTGAREISMSWTYVVDSFDQTGWNIGKITSNIRTIRGYFAQIRNTKVTPHENLVIRFKMWSVGGTGGAQRDMTCLIKSVDVKYGDTIVAPPNHIGPIASPHPTNRDQAFFLRTDITVDLRIWTQGIGEGGDDVLQKIDSLYKDIQPEWY